MTTVQPRKITGRGLCAALHVDYLADERWLDVVRTFDGIEIRTRESG